jgi:hypothetical protein
MNSKHVKLTLILAVAILILASSCLAETVTIFRNGYMETYIINRDSLMGTTTVVDATPRYGHNRRPGTLQTNLDVAGDYNYDSQDVDDEIEED